MNHPRNHRRNKVTDPRNIIVKMCLNADEFIDFSGDCKANGKTQSALLRDLWRSNRNGSPRHSMSDRPAIGQRMAFPPRHNTRPVMRLRN